MTVPNVGALAASVKQQVIASVIRTLVPVLVALVLQVTDWVGVTLDTETATNVVNVAISAAITLLAYLLVRLGELFKSSKFGWLLGYAKAAPLYLKPAGAAAAVAVDEQAAVVEPPAADPNV